MSSEPRLNFMEPSVTLIDNPDYLAKLELCGRNCYKSEEKITADSAQKLIKNIITRGHESVLEHYRIEMLIPMDLAKSMLIVNPYLRLYDFNKDISQCVVVGNVRAIRDTIKFLCVLTLGTYDQYAPTAGSKYYSIVNKLKLMVGDIKVRELSALFVELYNQYPVVFADIHPLIAKLGERYTILPWDGPSLKLMHACDYMTIRIITDRGISHEVVRHREEMSFSQESTRYVTYGNADGAMNFMLPLPEQFNQQHPTKDLTAKDIWGDAMYHSTEFYLQLLECGLPAQYARSVLPNSLKTDVIVTAPTDTFKVVYHLRSASGAHPQAQLFAAQLKTIFETKGLDITAFTGIDDIVKLALKPVEATTP